MYGVMIPEVSAGSNQVGASETCTAHVIWPSGTATADEAPRTAIRTTSIAVARTRPVLILGASLCSCAPLRSRGLRTQASSFISRSALSSQYVIPISPYMVVAVVRPALARACQSVEESCAPQLAQARDRVPRTLRKTSRQSGYRAGTGDTSCRAWYDSTSREDPQRS